MKQYKINKEKPYYSNIHNIYLYQYHDIKPNPINKDWLLGLTPTYGEVTFWWIKPNKSHVTSGTNPETHQTFIIDEPR